MGCQGEIYVVYGVQVDAKLEWESKKEEPPAVYSVNGHTVCDDEHEAVLQGYKGDIEFYDGIQQAYGPLDGRPLCIRVLGNSGWMGSRHFDGKALVGYPIGNECYINHATELPPGEDVVGLAEKLIDDIHDKLGIDVKPEQLRAHLLFDSLNGF